MKNKIRHTDSGNCVCNCKTINAITMDNDIYLLQIMAAVQSLQTHSPDSTGPLDPNHVPTYSSMRDSSEQNLMGPNDNDKNNNKRKK